MSVVLEAIVDLQKESFEQLREKIVQLVRLVDGYAHDTHRSITLRELSEAAKAMEKELQDFEYSRALLKTASLLKEEISDEIDRRLQVRRN